MEVQHPLAVVTPTLDGDILTGLALVEAAFTPGQLLRLLPTRLVAGTEKAPSVEGVRHTLARLVTQGIVDAETVGRATQYRLNRDHLAAESIIALARQRATLLTRLEKTLDAWTIRPVYGALFGSAARGQMRADSDIDIFLVRPDDAPEDTWEQQAGELASVVTRWTGNDTRVLDMTEAEVRAAAATGDSVLGSVADEGLTVAGQPAWLRFLLRTAARQ